MMLDALPALLTFAFVSSATPGPNNMMLLASGANFGFRRTIPHLLGVNLGFVAMATLVGMGLIGFLDAWPMTETLLRALCGLYLIWLAWRVATASGPTRRSSSRPLSFLEAAAFQWINPKAWAMALTAMAAYAPDRSGVAVLLVAGTFGLVNLPSICLWAAIGNALTGFLSKTVRLRVFNGIMAALLLGSSLPILGRP